MWRRVCDLGVLVLQVAFGVIIVTAIAGIVSAVTVYPAYFLLFRLNDLSGRQAVFFIVLIAFGAFGIRDWWRHYR